MVYTIEPEKNSVCEKSELIAFCISLFNSSDMNHNEFLWLGF